MCGRLDGQGKGGLGQCGSGEEEEGGEAEREVGKLYCGGREGGCGSSLRTR